MCIIRENFYIFANNPLETGITDEVNREPLTLHLLLMEKYTNVNVDNAHYYNHNLLYSIHHLQPV